VVKDAIWAAIREAIRVGLEQALEVLSASLGGNLDDYAVYLVLFTAESSAEADQMATSLATMLANEPAFQPLVHMWEFDYLVLHGPCPLDLTQDVPGMIADIIVKYPQLVEALGGTVSQQSTETGTTINISLPLTFLPAPLSLPGELGCTG
jgi:hypothetical protein